MSGMKRYQNRAPVVAADIRRGDKVTVGRGERKDSLSPEDWTLNH